MTNEGHDEIFKVVAWESDPHVYQVYYIIKATGMEQSTSVYAPDELAAYAKATKKLVWMKRARDKAKLQREQRQEAKHAATVQG